MKPLIAATTLSLLLAAGRSVHANEHWPQWRGPFGNGISDSTDLPTTWSTEENVVWKTPLPSWSGGTPIIWGDRIFVTSPSKAEETTDDAQDNQRTNEQAQPQDQGRGRGRFGGRGGRGFGGGRGGRGGREPGGPMLTLICLARSDGSVLWERNLDDGNRTLMKQNMSSPSPVTDGEHVWVVTGTGTVTAFDMEGNQVWQREIQQDMSNFGPQWGYASSPILHDGRLIIEVLQGNSAAKPSYLLALDPATGEEIWRQQRPTDALRESPDAYTTPVVLNVDGQDQIVVSGGDYVTGHDPATGKELWRAAGLNPNRESNYRIIASPVAADGLVYAPTRKRPLIALRAGGTGDITESHLAWKWDRSSGGPDVPTPISDGTYFYMVDDGGVVTCLDAKTGEVYWGPERAAPGTTSASPLLADGKLYVTNELGETTVLAAGPEYKKLGTNSLEDSYTLSSIAVAGNQLFIRTSTHLYCIGKTAEAE